MLIERISKITEEEFINLFLSKNKPVIITDAMKDWKAFKQWSPEYFSDQFGNEETQLYDDLFNCIGIIQLKNYITKYFGKSVQSEQDVPYIRWYTQLKNCEFEWSDKFFEKIEKDWGLPSFLPKENYLLPFNNSKQISPTMDNFPAKGLFISGKGAKTRLHFDPWCSDAVLCQIYGTKTITLYSPQQKDYLYHEGECVNIEQPNFQKFPLFSKASPTYLDKLEPGEIVFFPHHWFHHVNTDSDSISLTWNFVHISTWRSFFKYLTQNRTSDEELEVIKFFLNTEST